jgi:hypothetical protein
MRYAWEDDNLLGGSGRPTAGVPITVTGSTLAPGAPVLILPTRIVGNGVDAQQGQ